MPGHEQQENRRAAVFAVGGLIPQCTRGIQQVSRRQSAGCVLPGDLLDHSPERRNLQPQYGLGSFEIFLLPGGIFRVGVKRENRPDLRDKLLMNGYGVLLVCRSAGVACEEEKTARLIPCKTPRLRLRIVERLHFGTAINMASPIGGPICI